MLLAEELILLLLDDDSGQWLVRRRAVPQAVRVALVVELLARRAIALDDKGVLVPGLAGATGGDPILDATARAVYGRRPEKVWKPRPRELDGLLKRLRDKGVLRRGRRRRNRHLPVDQHPEARVRGRLIEVLQTDLRPDRHTALLVALVHELSLLPKLFPHLGVELTALSLRANAISTQLRTDSHYFDTTLAQDNQERTGNGLDVAGEVLTGVGDVFEVLELMAGLVKVATLPMRVVARVLAELP